MKKFQKLFEKIMKQELYESSAFNSWKINKKLRKASKFFTQKTRIKVSNKKCRKEVEKKEKVLVVVKNLDHHQKEDQTRKVLQFPQRKDQQDNLIKKLTLQVLLMAKGIFTKKSKPNSDYSIPSVSVEMTDKDVIDKIYNFLTLDQAPFI